MLLMSSPRARIAPLMMLAETESTLARLISSAFAKVASNVAHVLCEVQGLSCLVLLCGMLWTQQWG